MLHTKEKIVVTFAPVKVKIAKKVRESKDGLLKLQAQRTKANKKRKPYWQARIDAHFGLK